MSVRLCGRAITAILFDFDGTLVDSSAAIIACFDVALRSFGLPPADEFSVRRRIGLPLSEAFLPFAGGVDIGLLVSRYREEFSLRALERTRLLTGVDEMVRHFRERGARMGVVTSRGSRSTWELLRKFGLEDAFSTVVGADQVAECKPSPEPVWLALERLSESPDHAVLIGDTPMDMEAAVNSGTLAVGVCTGAYSAAELEAAGAHCTFGDSVRLLAALHQTEFPGDVGIPQSGQR